MSTSEIKDYPELKDLNIIYYIYDEDNKLIKSQNINDYIKVKESLDEKYINAEVPITDLNNNYYYIILKYTLKSKSLQRQCLELYKDKDQLKIFLPTLHLDFHQNKLILCQSIDDLLHNNCQNYIKDLLLALSLLGIIYVLSLRLVN
jgi:hypothetical protein